MYTLVMIVCHGTLHDVHTALHNVIPSIRSLLTATCPEGSCCLLLSIPPNLATVRHKKHVYGMMTKLHLHKYSTDLMQLYAYSLLRSEPFERENQSPCSRGLSCLPASARPLAPLNHSRSLYSYSRELLVVFADTRLRLSHTINASG